MTRSPLLLGVDTGGTYTDAVVLDPSSGRVVGSAKAPTTHDDLAIGIAGAVSQALDAAATAPTDVGLVSVSTTLATNALVEGARRAACLVTLGFEREALERAGLRAALGDDATIVLGGGHDPHGDELAPLDERALRAAVEAVADEVDAFAVTAQFSVRNPSHEIAARELIAAATGKPVTCSHHLSAALNGPARALTALLNARLIPVIDELLAAVAGRAAALGIVAPLMVVRGDGSLVSAAIVRDRPIETILSGPAASLIGARHLAGVDDGVIVDIGGTTTDIAVVRDGAPELAADGAVVGGHRTMVEAVAMRTHGIGGDSEVRLAPRAVGAELHLGPRRVTPLSVLAVEHPDLVGDVLGRQLATDVRSDLDGVIVWRSALGSRMRRLPAGDRALLDEVAPAPVAADAVATTALRRRVLERLVSSGAVRVAALTPTDAAHVLGIQGTHDVAAARAGAELFARRRDRYGRAVGADAVELATAVIERLVRVSGEAVLAAALARDGLGDDAVRSGVVAAALDRSLSTARADVGLAVPLIAVGAPAATYYPAVGDLLGASCLIADHAAVANAVGAAVGRIRIAREIVVTAPRRGTYRVHADEPTTVHDLGRARELARAELVDRLMAEMVEAGAAAIELDEDWHETTVTVEGRPLFVEGTYRIVASGPPATG